MPNIADITVKAANGTTDVVYTALTPSAGDKVPARWRANAASTIPSHRPMFELVAADNGTRDGRRVRFSGKYPVLQTVESVETVVAIVPFEGSFMIPQNVDATLVSQAVAQLTNLTVAALIRQCINEGQAPT